MKKTIDDVFEWAWFDESLKDYCLEHPYVLNSALASIKNYMNGSRSLLENISSLSLPSLWILSLENIIHDVSCSFDRVDPKIMNWFDGESYDLWIIEAKIYRSNNNLSHRQVIDFMTDEMNFRKFSLWEAIYIAQYILDSWQFDRPNKYLVIYIKDQYEWKDCRVLLCRYDSGSVEIYVNQMDPWDVRTPWVLYAL